MLIFESTERVDAPIGLVWRHMTEPSLLAAWMPGIEGLRTEDGGPIAPDVRLTFVARGSERTTTVADYEAETRIALQSTQGSFTATYRYSLQSDGQATWVTVAADCSAKGLARIIAPFIRPLIRKADQGQLALLKESVERG